MRCVVRVVSAALAAGWLVIGPVAGPGVDVQAAAVSPAPQRVAPPVKPPPAAVETPPPAAAPTEAALGLPLFPGSQFLASYDAGRGQRYYLFGTAGSFAEVVAYYKAILKQKGELVFDEPPVYMFEVGRFREDTMAFPAGVTVKDYTWGGSQGYLNPRPAAQPARFPTVIQIVPLPSAPAGAPRHSP
ncbi:MAG: hypothetical protein IMZ67_04110 [Acidobacteria bacterium]|nr:hypothetical protein [Acidobacteriota bacterium]